MHDRSKQESFAANLSDKRDVSLGNNSLVCQLCFKTSSEACSALFKSFCQEDHTFGVGNGVVRSAVLKRLSDDYVIIALYVDDRTKLPESEWVTSARDGKVKNTIGKKNADLQINMYGVNAQPYYVLVDHEGNTLVPPRAFDLDVDEYVDFLDKGLEEFKKR